MDKNYFTTSLNLFSLRKKISYVLLLIVLLLSGNQAKAQVANYAFSQTSGTYNAITGTNLFTTGWDNSVSNVTIPFTFNFNGTGYTTCNVSSNGFITFGATTPAVTNYTPISSNTAYAGAISALGMDLVNNSVRPVYTTVGVSPNRTFVVQWINARRFFSGASRASDFDFQIRLNESSNIIEVVYGSCASSYATDIPVQVGLRGANNADFNNRATTNNWPASTAGVANNATCNTGNGAGELPANGLTYTWTPRPVISSFSPGSLCANSAGTVTINGINFAGASVKFFNNISASASVNGACTQITTTLPTGASTGVITVTTPGGTANTSSFTVTAQPTVAAITGTLSVCPLGTTQLADATSGGSWSSATPSVATISGTGLVTGVTAGTSVITYSITIGGCTNTSTATVTVNTTPILSGPSSVCMGNNTAQLSPTTLGTWVSNNPSVATIDNSGLITTVAPGTVTFTYTRISTGCSATTSAFTVQSSPAITSDPVSQSVCSGSNVSFAVGATGTGITYQWYNGGTPLVNNPPHITGATGPILTITSVLVTDDDTSDYHCEVSGTCPSPVTSANAILTVTEKVIITGQPAATQTLCTGDSATFVVNATGAGLTYQWFNGATPLSDIGNISGSMTNTLTLNPLAASDASANYYCVVTGTGPCLPVTSSNAILIVNNAPAIASQPVATQTVCDDDPVSLSIAATGGSLTYQWYQGATPLADGGNISGATTNTLNFTPIHVGNTASDYHCVVSNSCVTNAVSINAEVIVNLKPKIPVQAIAVCSDNTFTFMPVDGVPTAATIVPPGTTYSWPAPVVTGGLTGGTAQGGEPLISDLLSNPTNVAQTATYTITPISGTAGACVGLPFTLTVTVNPVPYIVNFSSSVCTGEILNITPANGGGNIVPLGTVYIWGVPSVTGGMAGGTSGSGFSFVQTLINPTNAVQTATYNITATSGSCTGSTFTVTVNVNPKPALGVSLASQLVCSGVAITTVTLTNPNNVPGVTTYSWTRDNTGNVGGMTATGSGDISGILTNATATAQTTIFSIYATSEEGCISLQGTTSVTVNPNPIMTPISQQIICSGTAITTVNFGASVTGSTFGWIRTNTVNITGIAANDTTSSISGILTNNTNAPQTTTFTVTPTANGCSSPAGATTFNIIVNPAPSVSATPLSQTVCGGESFSITATDANSVSGVVYSFTKDSSVAGDSVSITGNTITGSLENNSATNRIVTFTITGTVGGCLSTTTATVTVKPNPAFTLTPASQNVCSGSAFTTINFPVVAGVTYSWARTNTLGLGNLSGLPDSVASATSISGTFTNHTTTSQTTTFTVTATLNGCIKTKTVSITVYPTLVAPIIGASQTVCALSQPGALTMTTPPTGGSGAYTYQWQRSDDGITWTNIGGATGATYQPGTIAFGSDVVYYHVVVTNICGVVTSGFVIIEPVNNVGFTFDVNNVPSGAICPGTAFTPQISSVHFSTSAVKYSWTADSNFITPATGGPTGTTSGVFLFIFRTSTGNIGPLTTQNNTNASVTTSITVTPSVYNYSSGTFLCSVTPEVINVTIRPKPVATATVPNTTICSGFSAGIVLSSNITDAATSFNWTRTNTGGPTSGSGNTGSISVPAGGNYTIPNVLTNNSGASQTTVYTITPTSNGCSGTPITVTITVAPALTPGTIGTDQAICSGGDPAALTQLTAATGLGTLSYQWQSGPSAVGPFTDILGATGTTYDPPSGLLTPTWYVRVVTSILNGVPCSIATTTPVKVSVNTINPGSISGDLTVCNPGSAALSSVAATGAGVITYQWQYNTTGCGGVWSDVSGATSATLNVSGLTVTTYYRRIAISTLLGTPCSDYSNCVTITVNNVTGGTVGTDQVLCGNNPAAFTEITASTGSGVLTYQWQSNTTGCGGTWSNISGATSAVYDAPSGLLVTTYYHRITTLTLNGVSCTASSNCITVTANTITGGIINGNRTVCSGGDPAAFTETTAATGTGLTYQWQSSLTGVGPWTDILGATGITYDVPGPVTQTTYYQRVAFATIGATTCQAASNFVTVFVNDVSPSVIAGDQTVCSQDPIAFTVTSAATGNGVLSYQWQSNTTGCGGSWSNIVGANSATYDPSVLALTTYYHVVVTSTLNSVLCTATSNCITVTSFAKTWNGSVNANWNNALNWTPNGVPTASNCIVIPNVITDPIISGTGYIAYGYSLNILSDGRLDVNSGNTISITDYVNVNPLGNFFIQNTASLVQTNNVANTGNIVMARITQPMYRFDYTYWNSPVTLLSNYTLGMLSQNLTQPDKYYSWNPTIGGSYGNWIQESNATIMNPSKGYIVRAPQTFSNNPAITQTYTAVFIGTPNNGDINIPIAIGTLGAGTTDDKMNLIGNPYPSAVSANAFLNNATNATLMDGTIYFWTHHAPPSAAFANPFYGTFVLNYSPDGYASYNASGGTNTVPLGYGSAPPNGYIAAGQSFFVTGKANGTAIFNNAMRVNGANDIFFRSANDFLSSEPERNRIWLNLADNQGSFSQALVGYIEGATNGIDRSFDGDALSSNAVSLYSLNSGKMLGIQGRALPFDENDQIPMGYSSSIANTLTIGIDQVDGFFPDKNIYLEDKLFNVIHDLKQAPYSFATASGTFDDRFVLRFTSTALGTNHPENIVGLTAFIKNSKLFVEAGETIERISIYDISGKLIKTYIPENSDREFEGEFPFAEGIYLSKIKLQSGIVITSKLSNANE